MQLALGCTFCSVRCGTATRRTARLAGEQLLALVHQGRHVGQGVEDAAGTLEDLRVGSMSTEMQLLLDEPLLFPAQFR